MRSCILTIVAFMLVAAAPQDKPVPDKGGLKPGSELPGTFHPYNVTGKFKGRFHCLVCQHGLNPVAAVFVRGTDDLEAVGTLLQKLDEAVNKNAKARLASFAVFVDEQLPDVVGNDDKRDDLAKKLEDVAGKLERVVVALESKANLDKFKLDADAEVEIVLYNNLKVVDVKKLAKGKLTKESIPALVSDIVAKLTGKK